MFVFVFLACFLIVLFFSFIAEYCPRVNCCIWGHVFRKQNSKMMIHLFEILSKENRDLKYCKFNIKKYLNEASNP